MTSRSIEYSMPLPRYIDFGERDAFRGTYEFAAAHREHRLRGRLRRPPLVHARDEGPLGAHRVARRHRRPHRAAPPRHRRLHRRLAPPGQHLRAGLDARPDLERAGRARRRHRLPALRVQGLQLAVRAARPPPQRDARGAPQGVDHGQLRVRRRVLPLRRPAGLPARRPAAPPPDLRRRHVEGGHRAGRSPRRHLVHAADGDPALRHGAGRAVPRRVREVRHDARGSA